MRADVPDFPSSSPGRTASIINFFVGVWVLISPFVLRFTNVRGAVWNNVVVGIVIMILAGTRAWARSSNIGLSWINFILGIWLIVSAFVFGFRMTPVLTWNNVISGIVVAIIAAVAAMGRPSVERVAP